MEQLEKKKALAGCVGCIYEDEDICPADPNNGTLVFDFSVCTDDEKGAIIFVRPTEK